MANLRSLQELVQRQRQCFPVLRGTGCRASKLSTAIYLESGALACLSANVSNSPRPFVFSSEEGALLELPDTAKSSQARNMTHASQKDHELNHEHQMLLEVLSLKLLVLSN